MSDLISRQDALKALDEMSYKSPHESATSVVRKKHFGEILEKFIMQQPSAQQWIPCSERLPEPWTSVLVTYIYNGKRFVEESQYTGQDDERGNPLFSSYADEYKVRNAYFQKIAWMPLPEPYRGESGG